MTRRAPMILILSLALTGCQRVSGVNFTTSAKVMRDEPVAKSFKTSATPKVIVDVFAGSIAVTRGDEATVDAEVTKRGGGDTETEALEMLKKLDLKMEQDGDTIRIVAKTPPGERYIGEAPAKLKVPAGANLELRTTFNDIAATGISGSIEAKSSNGALVMHEVSGSLKLNTSFGKIDIDGPATNVQAITSNGAVTIKQVKGPISAKSSFGEVNIESPSADVDAETSNGKIRIHGATGQIRAHTSFGDVEIAAQEAHVKAESSNGAVTFAGSLADGESLLKTSFGSISVTLPADAQFQLEAQTSFGSIDTGFKLATDAKQSKTQVRGTVGENPKSTLKVVTSNGNIQIRPS
jgi:DUF4097 and DUF4098 domain-containing protein YvlB